MSLPASIQKLNNTLFLKGEHQAALAYLGQLALSDPSAAELAAQAAAAITQVLQVEYSLLWELAEDGQSLLCRAGSGWLDEMTSVSLDADSLEMETLSSPQPVFLEKSLHNTQTRLADQLIPPAVIGGVSVRIGTMQRPYGVIQVFSTQAQLFSPNDIHFLQSVASTVGLAIRQGRCCLEKPDNFRKENTAIPTESPQWDQYEIKNRLIESVERERLRLAQDLHDIPIQDLYGMIYQFDDLKDVFQDKDAEGIQILEECNQILQRVINSLRTVCRELRPPSLSPFGLEVAIRDHVEKFRDQNPGITVHLALMQDKQVLSDSLRLTLFRIYQQAIHNIARHAQATEAYIRFHWDEEKVVLEIEDNGTGFEVPRHWMELVREEHFGLLGIAERVESVRGKLELVSAPRAGTLLRAIIPYSRSRG